MTHQQSEFLKSKVDGFCLSQLQGEVAAYCTNAYREWFERWPEIAEHFKDDAGITLIESQLTNEQMKQLGVLTKYWQLQIRSYLYHASTTSGRTRIMLFTKTEYKANPEVKAEIVTQIQSNNDYKDKPCISILCSEAAKSMAARGEEFMHHMEMEAKIECARHVDQAKADLDAICTPTEVLKTQQVFNVECLEGLSGVVGQLLDAIHETTGWHGSVYLGGPDPQVNREVHVFSFHHWKGSSGFNFCDALPDHHGRIVEPFTAFLKGAFTANTCHPSTNSSATPPAGESLVNETSHSVSPDITMHPDVTALATPQSSTPTLEGPSRDVVLLDGIHQTPSVPLLNPLLSLEHLLSLDPNSLDFSQVDFYSFNLPRLPSLPPSPFEAHPLSASATPLVSTEALGASHHPAIPTDPAPLTSPVTSMDSAPSTSPVTSMDTGPLTSVITSKDAVPLTSAVTSVDGAPLTFAVASMDATPTIPQPESLDHTASPMCISVAVTVGNPVEEQGMRSIETPLA
ncbi:hypothetical protein DFJ58DRAFT_735919 [Suillus subalutaceus]|uniref:uncharacterized protein n=1 Tax=Suillus subalutaceus TaxID=48586 RepID=UPI001B870D1D|nr:uncharacterized protein DFJ58DRAFT_735919 [Suillus subalutaceus]KAG1834043.1 hypothetical protein DFJ58DRAFT_735919 [Suillus subalutaceus]